VKAIVAYLDVLGFSVYSEKDLAGAQLLLRHQEFILQQKFQDGQNHPASSYTNPSLAALAEAHLVDSFKHFLPFSDSIFIVSENPDKFARQLSNYLIACLRLVERAYDNPARTEVVEITDIVSGKKHQQHWYPPIWRGGIAIDEVATFKATGIEDGKPIQIPNLAGLAVVKAARLEELAKREKFRGPRLFCETGFEKLFGPDIQPYFIPVKGSVSEFLWPAFLCQCGNSPQMDMQHFHDLWRPAVYLWKSKQGQPVFEHYDEFLKLLVRSFLRWADVVGCGKDGREKVRRLISADLAKDLIEAYLH
jgi:hypothetical protein